MKLIIFSLLLCSLCSCGKAGEPADDWQSHHDKQMADIHWLNVQSSLDLGSLSANIKCTTEILESPERKNGPSCSDVCRLQTLAIEHEKTKPPDIVLNEKDLMKLDPGCAKESK